MNYYPLYEGHEDQFQIALATYLDSLGVLWFHVANERKTNVRQARNGSFYSPAGNKLKAKGVKPGVPDVWIIVPQGEYPGLILELKTKSNKVTPEQGAWLDSLNTCGYLALATWSLDQAIDLISAYLNDQHVMLESIAHTRYINSKKNIYELDDGKIKMVKKSEL